MRMIAKCPNCGHKHLLESTAVDKRARCQKCQKLFKLPKPGDVERAANIIKKAKARIYVDEEGKTFA